MHCQKSLKGPGTVLNGFPSKQAYKFCKTTMVKNPRCQNFTAKHTKNAAREASIGKDEVQEDDFIIN